MALIILGMQVIMFTLKCKQGRGKHNNKKEVGNTQRVVEMKIKRWRKLSSGTRKELMVS